MRRGIFGAAGVAATLLALPLASADGQSGGPSSTPIEVTANGNGIYDSQNLRFAPFTVNTTVGHIVRWTNTDLVVPHTVTENHGLFDLAGTYGATPINPAGFAPHSSVQRTFDAGTFRYYCRVHPVQMHGIVAVPVTLGLAPGATVAKYRRAHSKPNRKHKRRRHKRHHRKPVAVPPAPPGHAITATWAVGEPASGQVFDVRYRAGNGAWRPLALGTRSLGTSFAGGAAGTVWQVESRLRSAADATRASDWSPAASITS